MTAFSGSIVALLLVGCDAATLIAVNSCSGLVAVVITTPRTVVRVGETITLDANFDSPECVSSGIITHNWRWSSSDASIARVDSLSGLVEGVGPGQVVIEVRRPQNSEVMGSTALTVVAD
ncbi:MAG TPA: Ig-like domain-containing protein [Gemmatimonadales bacterium]